MSEGEASLVDLNPHKRTTIYHLNLLTKAGGFACLHLVVTFERISGGGMLNPENKLGAPLSPPLFSEVFTSEDVVFCSFRGCSLIPSRPGLQCKFSFCSRSPSRCTNSS